MFKNSVIVELGSCTTSHFHFFVNVESGLLCVATVAQGFDLL